MPFLTALSMMDLRWSPNGLTVAAGRRVNRSDVPQKLSLLLLLTTGHISPIC